MDVSTAIIAKSDQMNAIDLLGGDLTVTIVDTKPGSPDQPVNIITDAYGPSRPFKPSKTVLRDIVQAWGLESQVWIGRRLTLFNDPTVLWAGQAVGGIRVKAMSNIDKAFEATHTITRGKSKKVMIQPLPDAAPARDFLSELTKAAGNPDAIKSLGSAARAAGADDTTMNAITAAYNKAKESAA